ncbi:MAG: peptidoglycan-associated lipoprotein Pal [Parvularculaceae bacterium]
MNYAITMKSAVAAAAVLLVSACASNTTGPDIVAAPGDGSDQSTRAQGPVPGSQADLEANAGHRVFFGYDEYALTTQARDTLARQASWLKQYPNSKIIVSGNCDERGTREYNLALGARRANAARAYLVSLGVDSSRITTVSYGKDQPIDPRSTPEAWARNRNATSTIAGSGV